MKPATIALPLLLCLVGLPSPLSPTTLWAAGMVATPEAGVVCDSVEQLCYDRGGLALDATRRNFGRRGENKARRLLDQGETGRKFKLSNGIACDTSVRLCWDDGWKRRNVAKSMTRQLFSGSSQSWNETKPGGGSSTSAECLLRQAGRTVFQGSCELQKVDDGGERRVIATLRNGPRYVFQNQGGKVWISDARGGRWPVKHRDHGQAVVFVWADMNLEARQGSYGGGSAGNRTRSLEDLLRQLFN